MTGKQELYEICERASVIASDVADIISDNMEREWAANGPAAALALFGNILIELTSSTTGWAVASLGPRNVEGAYDDLQKNIIAQLMEGLQLTRDSHVLAAKACIIMRNSIDELESHGKPN